MGLTFLGVPVNTTASPEAETVSSLEKRKTYELTKDISKPDLICSQVEWILSFNMAQELNIQRPDRDVIKLEAGGSIHDCRGIWHGDTPIYLILKEGASPEVLAKCVEVKQISVPGRKLKRTCPSSFSI